MLKLLVAFAIAGAAMLPLTNLSAIGQTPLARSVVDLQRRRVDVYQGDRLLASFAVAIGKPGWETPIGTWKVNDKISKPAWTNFLTGKVMPPGGKNPMGSRWIGFYKDSKGEVGFHGTKDLSAIGKAVSHGCLRMREVDVQELFELLEVGSIVKVI
jgi:lipoprotein-anchoring transpeptidase ErfK/SrfK